MRNKVLQGQYHINRLKRAKAITPTGIVTTHKEYLQALQKAPLDTLQFEQIEYHQHEAITNTADTFYVHIDAPINYVTEDIT